MENVEGGERRGRCERGVGVGECGRGKWVPKDAQGGILFVNGFEGKLESAKPHEHGEKNNMRRWSWRLLHPATFSKVLTIMQNCRGTHVMK